MTKHAPEAAELRIAKLLRYGTFLSGFCIAIGFVANLVHKPTGQPSWQKLTTYETLPLTEHLQQLHAAQQWGQLICYLGLFVLISLPILRVLLTGVLFVRNKEFALAAMAFFVFLVLVLGFVLGVEIA